jgi:hypothetical protein
VTTITHAWLGVSTITITAFVAGFRYFEKVLDAKRWAVDRALEIYHRALRGIRAARQPVAEIGRDSDHRVILVPRSAGPVIESPDCKHPQPITRVPIRSSKAAAKRGAHRYFEQRAGRPTKRRYTDR